MQLWAKGFLLIKDAKELDATAYADFISAFSIEEEKISIVYSIYPSSFSFYSVNNNISMLIYDVFSKQNKNCTCTKSRFGNKVTN
jgi:hypothetical protein